MSDSIQNIRNVKLLENVRAHFNEPMLAMFDLVRCVGYGEDEDDCYIIARRPNPNGDLIWLTCVGGYTFLNKLEGQEYVLGYSGEHWDDLTRLDNLLTLNGAPREPEFKVIIELEPKDGEEIFPRFD